VRLNSLKEDRIDRNYDVCHFCVAGGKVPLTNRMGAMAGFPAPTGSSGGGGNKNCVRMRRKRIRT